MKFGERIGLIKVDNSLVGDGIPDQLRTKLWNVLDVFIWQNKVFCGESPAMRHGALSKTAAIVLWDGYYYQTIDSVPSTSTRVVAFIKNDFFSCEWHKVYELIELIDERSRLFVREDAAPRLVKAINRVLEDERSMYRLIGGNITQITDPIEVKALVEALNDDQFSGVQAHLNQALRHYSSKDSPDYKGSIRESITAVEALCRTICGKKVNSLGTALDVLEKKGELDKTLKLGFEKLYGFTNGKKGIRHALMEKDTINHADAKYFLLSCTSFINYLKSKM